MAAAAAQGHAAAQFNLVIMYYAGSGVPRDFDKALMWLEKAAKQGHSPALYSIGDMYATGEGVGRDDKKAFRWFQKAADQGSARAQYRLGLMYDHGPARARTLPGPFNGIAWRRSKETLKHM